MNEEFDRSDYLFTVLLNSVKRLEQELADYKQTCGELCDVCGWRTVFPGIGCVNCRYHDSLNARPPKLRLG